MKQKKHNSGMVKWQFDGFYNWPAGEGWIDLVQYMNLQRATFYGSEKYDFLTENFCRECICWREADTCRQVLVQDVKQQNAWHCVCPILFFDFIGRKLPEFAAILYDTTINEVDEWIRSLSDNTKDISNKAKGKPCKERKKTIKISLLDNSHIRFIGKADK